MNFGSKNNNIGYLFSGQVLIIGAVKRVFLIKMHIPKGNPTLILNLDFILQFSCHWNYLMFEILVPIAYNRKPTRSSTEMNTFKSHLLVIKIWERKKKKNKKMLSYNTWLFYWTHSVLYTDTSYQSICQSKDTCGRELVILWYTVHQIVWQVL